MNFENGILKEFGDPDGFKDKEFAYAKLGYDEYQMLSIEFRSVKTDTLFFSFDSIIEYSRGRFRIPRGEYKVVFRSLESENYSVKLMQFESSKIYTLESHIDDGWEDLFPNDYYERKYHNYGSGFSFFLN